MINIDDVSLTETPRSERIKNALDNPMVTSNNNEERGTGIAPRSNFLNKGIERAYGMAQPQKFEQFHQNNNMIDTIIHQSINMDLESK